MYKIDKISKENELANLIMKIISIALYIIIIPIIIFNFTLIVQSFVNPKKTPDFFGYKTYIIISRSMEPTLNVDDDIFIKRTKENDIKVNDIISFKDGEDITTHRVIKIQDTNGTKTYTTKGDNNTLEDKNKVYYSQIEGVYKFKIRGFGKVIDILKNKIVLFVIVLILIINIIFNVRLNKKRKERREKRILYEKQNEK